MAEDNRFTIKIITPDREFYEGEAVMVEFNTVNGQVGIYKNHIPMTMIIRPGVLTITEPEGEKVAALHAGFVEILPDSVTILAEVIEWPDEIDEGRAEAARDRAQKRLSEKSEGTDVQRAEIALMRSLARIAIIK